MRRLSYVVAPIVSVVAALAAWIGIASVLTEREIAGHSETIRVVAGKQPAAAADATAMQALPLPMQRYLRFALPTLQARYGTVSLTAEGEFRRPLTERFAPTTAAQTIAVGTPALMFAATTPIVPGLWARAYDFFADGRMEMRAKIASTFTVVSERATEALNRTSLRRWHGSGEHAARSDYRRVAGMMIPHGFEIARAAGGKTHPFWRGRITSIAFE